MKHRIITMLYIASNLQGSGVYGQVYGTYYSYNSTCIIVDSAGVEFRYAMNWDGEYTMNSKCSAKMLNCNLIEISTLPYDNSQYKDIKIEKKESTGEKYCKVEFCIPNLYIGHEKYAGYRIEIATSHGTIVEESFSESCVITVGKDDCITEFKISPFLIENYFKNGMYLGLPFVKYVVDIPVDSSNIKIDIPITYNYFRKWRINKEFIKIINDSELMWRGYLYKLKTKH